MRTAWGRIGAVLLVCGMAGGASARAQQVTFTPLGVLPGYETSAARAVSADGAVVVGECFSSSGAGRYEGVYWKDGSMVAVGALPGGANLVHRSLPQGVSADGAAVVGWGDTPQGPEAFLWITGIGGPGGLGRMGVGLSSEATGISGSNYAVVGTVEVGPQRSEAFFKVNGGGIEPIGDLPGEGRSSVGYGVSLDGRVAVGAGNLPEAPQAFRWKDGVLSGLGFLPGGSYSIAYAVNAEGSAVVGYGSNASGGTEAFRWTPAGGMQGLGDLAGGAFASTAYGVSGDSTVVIGVGAIASGNPERAMLWRADMGMVDLRTFVVAQGATGLTGWTLERADAISTDGSTIVGSGRLNGQQRAWRLRASNSGGFRTLGAQCTITGRVLLQGLNETGPPQSVSFELRPEAGGKPLVFVQRIGAGAGQRGYIFAVPPGRYTLAVKAAAHLRAVVSINASQSGSITVPDVPLLTGDTNNDNRVNLTDLVQLRSNYGKAGTNLTGDLNGDGKVNLSDLVLLRGNYGKVGVP